MTNKTDKWTKIGSCDLRNSSGGYKLPLRFIDYHKSGLVVKVYFLYPMSVEKNPGSNSQMDVFEERLLSRKYSPFPAISFILASEIKTGVVKAFKYDIYKGEWLYVVLDGTTLDYGEDPSYALNKAYLKLNLGKKNILKKQDQKIKEEL